MTFQLGQEMGVKQAMVVAVPVFTVVEEEAGDIVVAEVGEMEVQRAENPAMMEEMAVQYLKR